jgi:hypothetical protein
MTPTAAPCQAAAMTENRFRVPVDELYTSVQVSADEQVEVHPEPAEQAPNWTTDPMPWVDGGSGDVDGG